jgi:hypothetical protein
MDFLLRQRLSVTVKNGLRNIRFKTKDMRIKINDKIYRLKEIESGVDSLMELVEEPCIEDTVRKFKKGDKVRIKHGVSSKTHYNVCPCFSPEMDDLIGKTMTVDRYTDWNNYVVCNESDWRFHEDWLEPYEELKEGDLAIFWDSNKEEAFIGVYKQFLMGVIFQHKDHRGNLWKNALKYESKEQFEKLIKGEI